MMKEESNIWLSVIRAMFWFGAGMGVTAKFCDIALSLNGWSVDHVFHWLSLVLMFPECLVCTVVLAAWLWCKVFPGLAK